MSLPYSKYLNISHNALISKGVYDGSLDEDSLLHIDPLLLKNCTVPEFNGAYDSFIQYFHRFIDLVPFVKRHEDNDRAYRAIRKAFSFSELPNTGLGYSRVKTNGRGIGGALSLQLTETAIEIIGIGIKNPEVFALLPLFEDNIGADRISDMAIYILFDRFLQYTRRVSAELGIKVKEFNYKGESWQLPSYNRYPIVFIPMSLLTDLPHAVDYDDIGRVCNYNNRLRNQLGELIGLDWAEYHKMTKPQIKRALIENPSYFNQIIERYSHYKGIPYDFQSDRRFTYKTALLYEMVRDYPLDLLHFMTDESSESVYAVVDAIIKQVKQLIENNYMWKIFNRRGRTPDEIDWQYYFFSVADTYIKASGVDVDINRETNVGIGNVDFKFSCGANGKTIVEVKRSENKDLLHGYVTQLPSYMRAESASYGIYVIIQESDNNNDSIQAVLEKQKDLEESGVYAPSVIIIDARTKGTASKIK